MKDHKDDKTLDIEDAVIVEEQIESKDMDELEAAIDSRMEWSNAVELVQDALVEWIEYNNDLYFSAADDEEAASIKRLSEETLNAWKRILQG